MEPILGDEKEPRRSWFPLIVKTRPLCVIIRLKGGIGEQSASSKMLSLAANHSRVKPICTAKSAVGDIDLCPKRSQRP